MEFILDKDRCRIYRNWGQSKGRSLYLDYECTKKLHNLDYRDAILEVISWKNGKSLQLYLSAYEPLSHRTWAVASLGDEAEGNFQLRQKLLSLSISYADKIVFVDTNSGKILKTGGGKIGKI